MVKKMGWDQPLGKRIKNGRVIGVVKDFHYDSLRNGLEAFVLQRFSGTQNIRPQKRDRTIQYLIVNEFCRNNEDLN